jgi:hypothetical protein
MSTINPTPTGLGYTCGENLVTNHLSYGLALAHQLTFKTISTTFQKGATGYEELSTSTGLWEELLSHYVRVTLPCESKRAEIFSHDLYLKMEADKQTHF